MVADANLLLATVCPLAYSRAAEEAVRGWMTEGVAIHAPVLWRFEAVSALRKLITADQLGDDEPETALSMLLSLPVEEHGYGITLHRASLRWAERLGSPVAYDASYVALADSLEAELWTADRTLAKRAAALLPGRVHSVLES